MSDHRPGIKSLCVQPEKAEKATAKIDEHLETVFSQSLSLNQLEGTSSAFFGHFLERFFQIVLRELSKS